MSIEYFRSRKLLDLARGQTCQACGIEDGTIVAAHSNQSRHGKGMHNKSHDCFIAWLCYKCHHTLDHGSKLSREERIEIWQAAHDGTILQLFQSGLVLV